MFYNGKKTLSDNFLQSQLSMRKVVLEPITKTKSAVSNAFAGFTERAAQYFPSNSRYNIISN